MKKVLIVDDQYTNIILLRECLNAESIECEYVKGSRCHKYSKNQNI